MVGRWRITCEIVYQAVPHFKSSFKYLSCLPPPSGPVPSGRLSSLQSSCVDCLPEVPTGDGRLSVAPRPPCARARLAKGNAFCQPHEDWPGSALPVGCPLCFLWVDFSSLLGLPLQPASFVQVMFMKSLLDMVTSLGLRVEDVSSHCRLHLLCGGADLRRRAGRRCQCVTAQARPRRCASVGQGPLLEGDSGV